MANATDDSIRTRAYELYVQRRRNGNPGDAASDWLQAERELKAFASKPTTSSEIEMRSQSRGETLLASGN
jgi:hypothetical protein